MIENGEDRTTGAGLGIGSGIDETRDAGMQDGAGAHGAGLKGADEGAAASWREEAIVAESEAGGAKGDDLCVGRGIGGAEDLIVAASKDGPVVRGKDEGADGDLAGERSGVRLGEGQAHSGFGVE